MHMMPSQLEMWDGDGDGDGGDGDGDVLLGHNKGLR